MQKRSVATGRVVVGACLALACAVVVTAKKDKDDLVIDNPPAANVEAPPATGIQPNVVASNYSLVRLAQGTDPLENPSGVITKYGLLSNGTGTEPDENTYLELDQNPGGPTAGYDYG